MGRVFDPGAPRRKALEAPNLAMILGVLLFSQRRAEVELSDGELDALLLHGLTLKADKTLTGIKLRLLDKSGNTVKF